MRILFLSRWFPFPPSNGSKLRIYNLLCGLSQYHEITLICFYEPSDGIPDPSQLLNCCQKIRFMPRKPFQPTSRRSVVGFFNRKPRSVIDTYSPEMEDAINNEISSSTYDLVIASQFDMAIYAEHFHAIPAIFEEAEVGVIYEQYSRAKSPFRRFRYGMTWKKHRNYLNSLLNYFRACTVVSNQEYQLLKSSIPEFDKIVVIPNFLNLNDYHKEEAPRQNHIVFTGSLSYYPNYEGMCWFLNEVFPKIILRLPDAHLTITGDPAGRTLPMNAHITQVGFVEDIRPYVTRASCSIVPIHTGGGTRLKILEAMALGTPVVSTSKGAEGLNYQHGINLLIADEPEAFANIVIQTLENDAMRKTIAENAFKLMNDQYSSKVIIPHYLELIDKTVSSSAV